MIHLKPLFNRATQAKYPPGSTFKIINTLIGLETGALQQVPVLPVTVNLQHQFDVHIIMFRRQMLSMLYGNHVIRFYGILFVHIIQI